MLRDSQLHRRVVVEGDSITAGTPHSPSWTVYAFDDTGDRFFYPERYNQATIGDAAVSMTAQIPRVTSLLPNIVTLLAGTNDLELGSASPRAIYDTLKTEWKGYLDGGASFVVAMTVLPRSDPGFLGLTAARQADLPGLNELIRGYAADPALAAYTDKIKLVDIASRFDPRTDTADGLHPNEIGAAKLGNAVQEVLGTLKYTADIENVGVDRTYYLVVNDDVAAAGFDAEFHFANAGWREGRRPNSFFDTTSYLEINSDVRAAGINPLQHYHEYGWREGRDPSAAFDTTAYLAANPDVAAANTDPLVHYLRYGQAEGRALLD